MENTVALGIVVATVLGSLLGLERSLVGKHAGMRTYALVSLGSALFSAVGVLASFKFALFAGINPLQLAGSVAIGIGFVGAGLMSVREHAELTTAAGIWLAAAIGVACGLGLYVLATISTLLGIAVFSLFARFEHTLSVRYGTKHEE